MRVTDEMVEAAYSAWKDAVRADRSMGNREAIRDALEAALALSHAAGQEDWEENCKSAESALEIMTDAFNSVSGEMERLKAAGQEVVACPECSAPLLYECVACSASNYPAVARSEGEGNP